ncbi:hypothetical protein [Flammeovirga aprica]|uniref:DUF4345 domain-containing protein n=1 Tax=Flammeovirga aprica JL-4 TaxID=694437 RepID=A0A7X9XD78_9BACT|nr:hypothetical protein [Flammeovirga aprica]NME72582.1 hypothetical protein [Flammeovirga aprica JL-4]
MKVVKVILKVLLGLMGLVLVYNGFKWAFLPENNLNTNGIIANTILGINMIKSDIGAPLMAIGLFQVLFVLGRKEFFFPLIIISLLYFVVRLVSYFVDGSHPIIEIGLVMEVVVPLLNTVLFKLINEEKI